MTAEEIPSCDIIETLATCIDSDLNVQVKKQILIDSCVCFPNEAGDAGMLSEVMNRENCCVCCGNTAEPFPYGGDGTHIEVQTERNASTW